MEAESTTALAEQIALAEQLLDARQLPEALLAFRAAESLGADPDGCSAARWLASMLGGDFEAAWKESDAIRWRDSADPHRFWTGEDVRGRRVIVRCLHGFGDAVQFLRYLPRLRALAAEVIVEVSPQMIALAPMLDGIDEVTTWGANRPVTAPEWDVQVEVMELPYLFRTTVAELPLAAEYLRLPCADVENAAQAMGDPEDALRVGLVWAAGEWNVARSIPLECMERLLGISGVEFWSLQGGTAASEVQQLTLTGAVRDAAVCGEGQRALAAVIANLDLVITVDTLAAHMAGAMGKPAWVLLQHAADWRWMTGRDNSPWYPKMKLFRQPAKDNWAAVIDSVGTELSRLVKDALARKAAQ